VKAPVHQFTVQLTAPGVRECAGGGRMQVGQSATIFSVLLGMEHAKKKRAVVSRALLSNEAGEA
jgi:hypothetical protein